MRSLFIASFITVVNKVSNCSCTFTQTYQPPTKNLPKSPTNQLPFHKRCSPPLTIQLSSHKLLSPPSTTQQASHKLLSPPNTTHLQCHTPVFTPNMFLPVVPYKPLQTGKPNREDMARFRWDNLVASQNRTKPKDQLHHSNYTITTRERRTYSEASWDE